MTLARPARCASSVNDVYPLGFVEKIRGSLGSGLLGRPVRWGRSEGDDGRTLCGKTLGGLFVLTPSVLIKVRGNSSAAAGVALLPFRSLFPSRRR